MKVRCKSTNYESYFGGIKHKYDLLETDFCCSEMKDSFDDKFIGFGEYDSMWNTNHYVNIYKCYAYPEGASWDEQKIRYCPFCQEEIMVETIE